MAGNYARHLRVAAAIRRELAQVLERDLHDPRVSRASVTEVTVSPDLRHAKAYISFLSNDSKFVETAMGALEKAKGFVRTTLASRLRLRYMPEIEFAADTLITESMRLDELIAKGLPQDD